MSVLEAKKKVEAASKLGISPTIEALDELLEELDDFFTFIEDYDEWNALYYLHSNRAEEGPQPGFSLPKLRKALGFNEDGTE